MLNIVLVEPEIPQNCGNIARTCAATRSRLHLIEPLGFDISEKAVRRAGLDYWPMVDLRVYRNLEHFFAENPDPDLWLATTKAPRDYTGATFRDNCYLFFGKETAGLPEEFRLAHYDAVSGFPCGRTPAASTCPTPWPSWPTRHCASRGSPSCPAWVRWQEDGMVPSRPGHAEHRTSLTAPVPRAAGDFGKFFPVPFICEERSVFP